MPKLYTVLIL